MGSGCESQSLGRDLHAIVPLAEIAHLPGCNGGSFPSAECFDWALQLAAMDGPSLLNSAQNYEWFFTNK